MGMLKSMANWWRRPPQWPATAQPSPWCGAIAAVVLFFVPRLISEVLIAITGLTSVSTFPEGLTLTGIAFVTAIGTLSSVRTLSEIGLKCLFVSGWPTARQWIKWGAVGALLGSLEFAASLCDGVRLGEPGFAAFLLTAVTSESLLYPIIEEPIYRGVALAALAGLTRSRALAYLGSIALFTLSHAPSHADLVLHGTLGLGKLHLALIIAVGLFTAHAYWTTGKLSLCMLVHGLTNGMQYLGILTGYLIDYPPCKY